jgi:hypothetical protein
MSCRSQRRIDSGLKDARARARGTNVPGLSRERACERCLLRLSFSALSGRHERTCIAQRHGAQRTGRQLPRRRQGIDSEPLLHCCPLARHRSYPRADRSSPESAARSTGETMVSRRHRRPACKPPGTRHQSSRPLPEACPSRHHALTCARGAAGSLAMKPRRVGPSREIADAFLLASTNDLE